MNYLQNIKNTFFVILAMSLISCNKETKNFSAFFQKDNGIEFKEKAKLIEKQGFVLKLDSISSYNGLKSLKHSIIDNEFEYISFLNPLENSVKYYDLNNIADVETIKLEKEGENGVGNINANSSFLFLSKDNISIYSENAGKLFFVNKEGVLLKEKNISFYEKKNNTIFPCVFASDQMIFAKDNILFSCFNISKLESKKSKTILNYNISNDSIDYKFNYPELYIKAFWAAQFKYLPAMAYNKNTTKLILNYPVSPYLYIGDLKGVINDSVFVGSKFITEAIMPYNYDPDTKAIKNRDWARENSFSSTQSDYHSILYDSYRNVYYRFTAIRPTLEEIKKGNRKPDYSIIICDAQLNKIGETEVLDTDIYSLTHITLTKKGLAIARKDLYEANDEFLTYSIFDLKYNEE